MADSRRPDRYTVPVPGARFRCLLCQRFVAATEHGVCPGCGRGPSRVSQIHHHKDDRLPRWAVFAVLGLFAFVLLVSTL